MPDTDPDDTGGHTWTPDGPIVLGQPLTGTTMCPDHGPGTWSGTPTTYVSVGGQAHLRVADARLNDEPSEAIFLPVAAMRTPQQLYAEAGMTPPAEPDP